MNYRIVNIRTTARIDPELSILIIYTGGTIGMIEDEDGVLVPFNFGKVIEKIPEIRSLELRITVISFPDPIDSSNVGVSDWQDMAYIIYENYSQYDGFVILHGTDTMSYSASALSFILQGLNKPVIFTGAQIPIGHIRSDARENLITSLEIASARKDGRPLISEVCVYFNTSLLRGNRSKKVRSSTFAAFETPNYPVLAESGIFIKYNEDYLLPYSPKVQLKLKNHLESNVTMLRVFPGMQEDLIRSVLNLKGLRGLVLETFGSGNTTNHPWFLDCISKAIKRGVIIMNVSQCIGGEVIQGRYETSAKLDELGVVSGKDITAEAAVTKLMFLLGNEKKPAEIIKKLGKPLVGEMDN
jgi:L-asparaginase